MYASVRERQSISVVPTSPSTLGGTFSITLAGSSTPQLPWNASAAVVQSALQTLRGAGSIVQVVAVGNASVGMTWYVTFVAPAAVNLPPMTVSTAALTGGAVATVTTLEDGSSDLFLDPIPADYFVVRKPPPPFRILAGGFARRGSFVNRVPVRRA